MAGGRILRMEMIQGMGRLYLKDDLIFMLCIVQVASTVYCVGSILGEILP